MSKSVNDKIIERTLPNGLRVVVCPRHTAPVVNVTVMYAVGSYDERPGIAGLAHLFEHLMFDNNSSGSEKQYDTLCTQAGGSNNAYTTYNYTTYYITLPAHQLELGLWLESERMRTFAIDERALETQRSVVLEEIKQNVDNQPYAQWHRAQAESAYSKDSSYNWEVYGSPTDIASVKLQDARDFYNSFYDPSNAVLCIAGDVKVEEVLQLIDKHYGTIVSRSKGVERRVWHPEMRRTGTHAVVDDDVPFPAVMVAFHVPGFADSRMIAEEILTTGIGQGKSSALHTELVKRRRVASAAGAYLDQRQHSSLITMYAYANDGQQAAQELFDAIMETVQAYQHTDVQHEVAVNRLRTSTSMSLQRSSGLADLTAWSTLFWNEAGYAETAADEYQRQAADDVRRMMSGLFVPANSVRVDVVPNRIS